MPSIARTTETTTDDRDIVDADYYFDAEEGRRVFDSAVRSQMGISGEEFIRRWEAGEYWEVADQPESRHIGRLIMMIPLARQDS
jgi:hypothetical protein